MIPRMIAWSSGMLATHLILSLLVLRTVARDHRAVELDQAFFADDAAVSVVVAGASHARNAVAAEELGGISMAVAGEHALKTRYRLPYLLDRSDRAVGAVILELDSATFSSWKTDDYTPEVVWGRYVPFLELGWLRGEPFDYAGMWVRAHAAPYVGEWEDVLFWRAGLRAFQDEDDLERFKGQPPAWMRKDGAEAAALHLDGQSVLDPAKIWGLRSLITELRARQVHVVLVSFPVTREYSREARRRGAGIDVVRAQIEDLLEPGVVDHLDHERDYFADPRAFYDGDHLGGAARLPFTRTLRRELWELGVPVR